MRIAIHQNKEIFDHSTIWDKSWIKYCQRNNLDYDIVNCFDTEIMKTLQNYDCLLWHFSNYSLQEMNFATSILNSAEKMGLKVFPDFNTSWHFDDKIAEMYYLQSVDAPLPKSWVFYTQDSANNFFDKECEYPIVAKLKSGSGSSNVKLLKDKKQAISYSRRMFSKGFDPAPNIMFKVKSNIKTAENMETIVKRFKRIPDFIENIRNASQFPNEKGYVYLQEFIPNDGFDLKIVVIGDKLSFIVRDIRQGDFRASGGGTQYFDKTLVTKDIIQSAFEISDKLNFQCMGFDYVVDKRTGTGKIIEISYGLSHTALLEANGYWDREGNWNEKPLNAAEQVLINVLNDK